MAPSLSQTDCMETLALPICLSRVRRPDDWWILEARGQGKARFLGPDGLESRLGDLK